MKNSGEVFLPLRGGGEGGVTTVHIAKPNAYNWKLQLKGLEGLAGQMLSAMFCQRAGWPQPTHALLAVVHGCRAAPGYFGRRHTMGGRGEELFIAMVLSQ